MSEPEFPQELVTRCACRLMGAWMNSNERALAVNIVLRESGHAELVAALKLAREEINTLEVFGGDDPTTDKTIDAIDAALRKAGGSAT